MLPPLWREQFVSLEHLEDGAGTLHVVPAAQIEAAVTTVLAAAAMIRTGNFEATPSPVKCSLCPYQLACTHAHGMRRHVSLPIVNKQLACS